MNTATLLLFSIGITYGTLTAIGGITQLSQKKIHLWASILMIVGGLLTAASIILNSILSSCTIYLLIPGLIIIHIVSINNGLKMYGKITIKHHIVRLFISLLIITLFIVQ